MSRLTPSRDLRVIIYTFHKKIEDCLQRAITKVKRRITKSNYLFFEFDYNILVIIKRLAKDINNIFQMYSKCNHTN